MAKKYISTDELMLIVSAGDEKKIKAALKEVYDALENGDVALANLKVVNESLLGEKNTIQNQLIAADSNIELMTTQIEDLEAVIVEKNQIIIAKNEELDSISKDMTAALQQIEDLGKQLDLQQKTGGDGLIVTVNGKAKKLIGNRFHLKGHQPMTAAELAKRPDLLEIMDEKKSHSLVDLDTVVRDDSGLYAGTGAED